MVSRQAARWVPENKTVLTNVLETIEMYCGVEDTNRHGGHRERAQRERERQERDDPPGVAGGSLPAPVPALTSQDPGPTPRLDKPGHPEPAHLGLNPSPPPPTRDAGGAAQPPLTGGFAPSAGTSSVTLTPTPTAPPQRSAGEPLMTANA